MKRQIIILSVVIATFIFYGHTLQRLNLRTDNSGDIIRECDQTAIADHSNAGDTTLPWISLPSGTTGELYSVHFPSQETGYATGYYGSGTIMARTTDEGITWTILPGGIDGACISVFFTSPDTGYVAGGTGAVSKTTDEGTTWTALACNADVTLRSIYFTSVNKGYSVGGDWKFPIGTITKTTDGGVTWDTKHFYADAYNLYSVHFPDANTGYAAGNGYSNLHEVGKILKTTDAGVTWTGIDSLPSQELHSVFFIDTEKGYAVGTYGTIIKTIDGGKNWTSQKSGTKVDLNSVFFTGANAGFAVGEGGVILKTSDGGTTWTFSKSGTNKALRSVFFVNSNIGYVVGASGTILKTTNGGGLSVEEGISEKSALTVYPNPASDKIIIETQVKGSISVLNLTGQELRSHSITAPKIQIDISTLPAGIYFVRVTGDKSVQVGKFVKQ